MAVWKQSVGGYDVVIHDVDHEPPHCHVYIDGRNVEVLLWTLEIRKPPPNSLPGKLRRQLKDVQEDLLRAWDEVKIVPAGSNTRAW
jgi:hypothetical protein